MTDGSKRSVPQLLMRRDTLTGLAVCSVPHGCSVRRAVQNDEAGIAGVLSRAFSADWDADRVRSSLTRARDVESVYVVQANEQVVGTASARVDPVSFPGEGYLHWVGVLPEWQRRGLGRAVCVRVLQRFAEMGLTGAVLETDDHRLDAVRLYLRLGFRPANRNDGDQQRWEQVLRALGEQKEW